MHTILLLRGESLVAGGGGGDFIGHIGSECALFILMVADILGACVIHRAWTLELHLNRRLVLLINWRVVELLVAVHLHFPRVSLVIHVSIQVVDLALRIERVLFLIENMLLALKYFGAVLVIG